MITTTIWPDDATVKRSEAVTQYLHGMAQCFVVVSLHSHTDCTSYANIQASDPESLLAMARELVLAADDLKHAIYKQHDGNNGEPEPVPGDAEDRAELAVDSARASEADLERGAA